MNEYEEMMERQTIRFCKLIIDEVSARLESIESGELKSIDVEMYFKKLVEAYKILGNPRI